MKYQGKEIEVFSKRKLFGKASTIVDKLENTDNLSLRSTPDADSTIADTIVNGKAGGKANDIASVIAGDIAEIIKIGDSLIVNEFIQGVGDIAGDIAGGISRGINEKTLKILEISKIPAGRKSILTGIGFVNNVKNYNNYLAPLISQNWITMTIPDKPTSP